MTRTRANQREAGTDATRVEVQDRFARLGPKIDEYCPKDLVRSLSSRIIEKLELEQTDALVDLGCGTGIYALDVIEQVPLRRPVIAVDPVPRMLDCIPKTPRIETVRTDALTFSESHDNYNKVLIKDVLYHIQRATSLFANLHRILPVGGVLLLVHASPPAEYPLFRRALSRWTVCYPEPSGLMNLLAHIGFTVDREKTEFEHAVPTERYLGMLRNRYFPVLWTFDDEEIEEGIRELSGSGDMENQIRLTERFDFVTAKKI